MLDPRLEREFEERLHDSSSLAFRVALSVLRRKEDAEEVAQEAFVRAYRGFSRLRDRDRFRAWIARIAWRLAIDHQRSERRRVLREEVAADPPPPESPEESTARAQLRERLFAAVDALPEKLRQVLWLSAIEGQEIREVGRLLHLPEGTVKSRLHFARKALIERMRCAVTASTRN